MPTRITLSEQTAISGISRTCKKTFFSQKKKHLVIFFFAVCTMQWPFSFKSLSFSFSIQIILSGFARWPLFSPLTSTTPPRNPKLAAEKDLKRKIREKSHQNFWFRRQEGCAVLIFAEEQAFFSFNLTFKKSSRKLFMVLWEKYMFGSLRCASHFGEIRPACGGV